MSFRRFEMHHYRQVLSHMRLGETDRAIARSGLMGRRKISELRQIALKQGWLDPAKSLPVFINETMINSFPPWSSLTAMKSWPGEKTGFRAPPSTPPLSGSTVSRVATQVSGAFWLSSRPTIRRSPPSWILIPARPPRWISAKALRLSTSSPVRSYPPGFSS